MITNILLCGVGGQGTVLAAKLLADAAIARGYEVKTTETIGMAQRGGSVVSHVRISDNKDEAIHSPLLPLHSADMIIGFEPAEVVRNLGYLKEDGAAVVSPKPVKPVTASLSGSAYEGPEMIAYIKEHVKKTAVIDTEKIVSECGTPKVVNIALLGAVTAMGRIDIGISEIKDAMKRRLDERFMAVNEKALEAGYNEAMEENRT